MRSILPLCVLLAACASKSGGTAVSPAGAALVDDRPLVTAGPRCKGEACRCRDVDAQGQTLGEAPDATTDAAPEGLKRFELRTGRGPDDVRVTVEGHGTLHKPGDVVEPACGYVDLAPGEHRVRMRVKAPSGQGSSPRLLIYERGERAKSWYGTFSMACGSGAVCDRAELEDRLAELRRPRGLFDPCGSVKIGGIKYTSQRDAEDKITELDLSFTMKVYPFPTRFPHGGTCKGVSPE